MKILMFSLLIVSLFSCGNHKSTPTKVSVIHSFALATDFGAGIILAAEKVDRTESFRAVLTSDSIPLTLTNGLWKFAVIAWKGETGKGNFTGEHHCGASLHDISPANAQITITIKKENCNLAPDFSPTEYLAHPDSMLVDQFKEIEFRSCMYAIGVTTSTSTCLSTPGISNSFWITVKGENKLNAPTSVPQNEIRSRCIPVSEFNATRLKFPLQIDSITSHQGILDFRIESFTDTNCTNGKMSFGPTGHFNHESVLNSYIASSYTNNIIFLEHGNMIGDAVIDTSDIVANPIYNSCRTTKIDIVNQFNALRNVSESQTIPVTCNNACVFYSNATCTTSIGATTTTTIAQGSSSSAPIYFKPTKALFKLTTTGNTAIGGDETPEILMNATYALIDENYLTSVDNLYQISSTNLDPNTHLAAGNYFIYETRQGNRGKMLVTNFSPPSTFTFNFQTFGNANVTNTSISITACFSGSCFLDFDTSSPVSGTSSTNTDFWYEDLGGSYYFVPQATAVMLKMP